MTVFNTSTDVDSKKQPMFFGATFGTTSYDSYKYPVFDKLLNNNLDISGGLKKFLSKKIELIIKHFVQNKNTYLLQT
jgi:hypothetical protein